MSAIPSLSYAIFLGELPVGEARLQVESTDHGFAYAHEIRLTVGGVISERLETGRANPDFELLEERSTARTGDEPVVERAVRVTGSELLGAGDEVLDHGGPWVCSALLSRFAARRGAGSVAVPARLVSTDQQRVIRTVLIPADDPIPPEAQARAPADELWQARHTTDTATITTFARPDGEVLVEEVSNGLRVVRIDR